MSRLTTAPAPRSVRSVPTPVPPAPEVPSTYLAPAHPFPSALPELALGEVHVLHSRIIRQLGREYLDPDGPHPVTLDRAQELADELDARQDFLPPAGTATPTEHRATTPQAPRDAGTARPQAAAPCPTAAAERHTTAPDQPAGPLCPFGEEQGQAGARIHDLTRVRPGEPVQVWHLGQLQYQGTVEETAPALGVVWIRETLDGYRRLIHAHGNTELRSHLPHRGG